MIVGAVAVIVMRVTEVMVMGFMIAMIVSIVVMRMVMMIMPALAVVVGGALGFEWAAHRIRAAALAAHQFGGLGRHVEHVGGDLGGDVAAAELPGEAQEPGRVLGPHLQERLGGGPDQNQAPVLEPQAVAVLGGGRLVEGGGEAEAARPGQGRGEGLAAGMVEGDAVDDRVGAEGGFADEGGGAQHEILTSGTDRWSRAARPIRRRDRTPRQFSPRTESPKGT